MALADPDPMIRIGALDTLETVSAAQIWALASPLLADSNRGVRVRAASLLASVPMASQPAADRDKFERAAAEFIAVQRLNADRPEGRSALGTFYAQRGLFTEAEAEFKSALRLSQQFAPAAINLADLYRQLGRDAQADETLRGAITASPLDAELHHALGLTLVRERKQDEALEQLHRAVEIDPNQARYSYVYAVALNSTARHRDAIVVLKDNLGRHPGDRGTLTALVGFSRDAGDIQSALEYAEQLAQITPSDSALMKLIEILRQQVASAKQ
jgi:Flp pilus assembly protein TadD